MSLLWKEMDDSTREREHWRGRGAPGLSKRAGVVNIKLRDSDAAFTTSTTYITTDTFDGHQLDRSHRHQYHFNEAARQRLPRSLSPNRHLLHQRSSLLCIAPAYADSYNGILRVRPYPPLVPARMRRTKVRTMGV
jgi:hypothetical protein